MKVKILTVTGTNTQHIDKEITESVNTFLSDKKIHDIKYCVTQSEDACDLHFRHSVLIMYEDK